MKKNSEAVASLLYIVEGKKKGPPSMEGLKKVAVYAKSVLKMKRNAMQKVDQTKKTYYARIMPKMKEMLTQESCRIFTVSAMQKVGQNHKVGLCKNVTRPEDSAMNTEQV